MERPIPKPIGTALQNLDTPSLYLEEEIFVHNCKRFLEKFSKYNLDLRPDVSLYRSSDLARFHMSQFPRVNSVYTNTISEASIFAGMGLKDILVGIPFPFDGRLDILADISQKVTVTIPVVSKGNVDYLIAFSKDKGFCPRVTIPLVTDSTSLGLYDYEQARDLAVYVQNTNGVELNGFTLGMAENLEDEVVQRVLGDVNNILLGLSHKGTPGLKVSIITSDFGVMEGLNFAAHTEVIDSSAIFESIDLQDPPVGVISSVMSHPQSDMVYLDCGQKSISIDRGMPQPIGLSTSYVSQMSAEHGYLKVDDENWLPKLGERVKLNPSDVSDTFNLYDYLNVISGGLLKTIYQIDARGCYV